MGSRYGVKVAVWAQKAPTYHCAANCFMVTETQEVTWGRLGHGNVLCNLSPLYQPFWWDFHFRLPVTKEVARYRITGFWVWFMHNSRWGHTHCLGDSCRLFVPSTYLSGKSLRLRSGCYLFFFHLPGCSFKKMVNPDGANHCREAVVAWGTTHFRVNVRPSSTMMVSVWLVRKASAEEENRGQSGWHKPHHSWAEAGI